MATFNIGSVQKTPADIGVDTSAYDDAVAEYEKTTSLFNSLVQGTKVVAGLVEDDKARKAKADSLAFQEWEATNLPAFEKELQEAASKAGEEGQQFSQGKSWVGNPFGKGGLRREHVHPLKEEIVSGLVDKQLNQLNLQTDEANRVKDSTRRIMVAQASEQFDAFYDAGLAKQVIRPMESEQSVDAYMEGAQKRLKDAPFTDDESRSVVKSEIAKTSLKFSENAQLREMAMGGADEIEAIRRRAEAMDLDGLTIAQMESNMRSSFNSALSTLDDQGLFEMTGNDSRTSQFIKNLQYASDPVQAEVLAETARDYKTLRKTPLGTPEQIVKARGRVRNTTNVTPFIAMKNRILLDRSADTEVLKKNLIVSRHSVVKGKKIRFVLGATAGDVLPEGYKPAVSTGSGYGGSGGGGGGGTTGPTLASTQFMAGTDVGGAPNLVEASGEKARMFYDLLAGTIPKVEGNAITASDLNNPANAEFINQFFRDSVTANGGVPLDEGTAPIYLREMQDNGLMYDPESESFAFDPEGLRALSEQQLVDRYNSNLGPGVNRASTLNVVYPRRIGIDSPYYFTGVDEDGVPIPIAYDADTDAYSNLLDGMMREPVYRGVAGEGYRGLPQVREYLQGGGTTDTDAGDSTDPAVENKITENEINTALNEFEQKELEYLMSQLNEAGLVPLDSETPTTIAAISASLMAAGVTTREAFSRLTGWAGSTEKSIHKMVGYKLSVPPSLIELQDMVQEGFTNTIERPKKFDQPTRNMVMKMLKDTGATEEMIETALREAEEAAQSRFLRLNRFGEFQDYFESSDVPYTKRHLIDTMKDEALVNLLKTVPDEDMRRYLLKQGIEKLAARPIAGAPVRAVQTAKKVGKKVGKKVIETLEGPETAGFVRRNVGKLLSSPFKLARALADPKFGLLLAAELYVDYKVEEGLQEDDTIAIGAAYYNKKLMIKKAKLRAAGDPRAEDIHEVSVLEYGQMRLAERMDVPRTMGENWDRYMKGAYKYVEDARESGAGYGGMALARGKQAASWTYGLFRWAGEVATVGQYDSIEAVVLAMGEENFWATRGGYSRRKQWRDAPAVPTAEEYQMFKSMDYFAETFGAKAPLLALESHSENGILLPANVVDSLTTLTGEPMEGWDSIWQDLSSKAMEAAEDWPVEVQQQFAQFVTKNGRVDVHGHMQLPTDRKIVNKWQYQAAVDYLVDIANGSSRVSYGVNEVSRGQALQALELLSDTSGTNIQNLHNMLREESLSSSAQDATPITDGLDLNSEELAPYVEAWESWEVATNDPDLFFGSGEETFSGYRDGDVFIGGTPVTRDMPDAEKSYLTWVAKGMPSRIGGVTRYPRSDYGKALGVHGGNDYLNISAVSYDRNSNKIALDSQLNPQAPYFLAYLDEMDVAPASPLEMKMAYQDFLQVQDTFTRFQSMQMASQFPEIEELKEFYGRVLSRGSGKVTDTLRDMGDRMVKARYTDPDLYKPVPDGQANRALLNHIGNSLLDVIPPDFAAKTLDTKGSISSEYASAVASGDLQKARKALEAKLQESKKVLYADMDRATRQGRNALTDDNRMNAEAINMLQRALNRIDAELNEQFEPFLGTSTHDSRVSIRWRPYAN